LVIIFQNHLPLSKHVLDFARQPTSVTVLEKVPKELVQPFSPSF